MKGRGPFKYHVAWKYFLRAINFITLCCSYLREWHMPRDIVYITSDTKNTQNTCDRSVLARVMPYVLVGSRLLNFWTRIMSQIPNYKIFYVVVFHWEQPWKEPNVNWIDLLVLVGKLWYATAVPAVPGAAPLNIYVRFRQVFNLERVGLWEFAQ